MTRLRFTLKELNAIGIALGFITAGDTDEFTDAQNRAFDSAHHKLSLMIHAREEQKQRRIIRRAGL